MTHLEDALKLVQAMGDYLEQFQQFRNAIAPRLRRTVTIEGDTYTSHGYDHCARILGHLNNLLEGHSPFFADVTPQELFCLGISVLYHDVVMTTHPELRRSHSVKARTLIRQEFEKSLGSIAAIQIPAPLVDAVGDIVWAHSDERDEGGQIVLRTLEAVKNQTHQGVGTIRTYLLAALLRFGDELDCTSQRIYQEQDLIAREQVASNSHWRMCALIREIKPPNVSRTEIVLSVNDLALNESDDKANDLVLIRTVTQKLYKALQEVNDTIFSPKGIHWWHFNTVKLTKESEGLISSIESRDPLGTATKPDRPLEAQPIPVELAQQSPTSQAGEEEEIDEVRSADIELGRKLTEWVLTEKMLKSGHFYLPTGRHARDWIDTSRLLEDRNYLGQIVKSFTGILKQRGLDSTNALLVGAGFPGLIIASQIGCVEGYGCSYIVPIQGGCEEGYGRLPAIPCGQQVVLVADVVAEGKTIRKVIDCLGRYGLPPERVVVILTVFLRRPIPERIQLSADIAKKLVPLNTEFPIELCKKDINDCVLQKSGLVEVINEDL